jgi:hypothetical protein
VPGPPGGDTETPGVPDGGTHNEIPGVSNGTTAETTEEAPEGDSLNTNTDEDDSAMVDYGDSSSIQSGNDGTEVIEDSNNSGSEDEDEDEADRTVKYTTPNI